MNIKNVLIFLLFLGTSHIMISQTPPQNFKIIGHRGACAYAPENTLISIKKALDFGVPMIEFDVHHCASGEIVVVHDFGVSRTTNGKGIVEKMSFDELRSLKIDGQEQIATLQEVLSTINRKAIAVIELKGQNTAEPVAKIIIDFIMDGWTYDDFLIVSFDHMQLKKVKTILPKISIGVTSYGIPLNPIEYVQSLKGKSLCLHPAFISQEIVQKAHAHNIEIYTYSHGTDADIWYLQQAISYGIDGVFADAPDNIFLQKN